MLSGPAKAREGALKTIPNQLTNLTYHRLCLTFGKHQDCDCNERQMKHRLITQPGNR